VIAFLWRNQPGQTCTWDRIWFLSGYPTNFAHISDPEVDAAYLESAATDDPKQIKKDCETVNKRMNEQVYNGWNWFTTWSLGAAKSVNGIYGPDLPDGSSPPELMAGFSRFEGLWKS
jgi:ABC-type transport system substrate-binding protein